MKTKKIWLAGIMCMLFAINAVSQATVIKGLTVVVEFTDAPFYESNDSVGLMMNQPGFSGWQNQGSVRDYFLTQSNGKVDISSEVIRVSMPNTVSYYYGGAGNGTDIQTIAGLIRDNYPNGFQNLTLLPDGSIQHFNVVCKAARGAWAFGQQPGNTSIKVNGQFVPIKNGNITTYGVSQRPEHNTVCHEIGHSIFGWTDYYHTLRNNLGAYCLMSSGGSHLKPQPINPALRLQKGWIDTVIHIGDVTQTYTAVSNSYSVIYKYVNQSNPSEYLLIHPIVYGGYYQQYFPNGNRVDQGLSIWYVDEGGFMDISGLDKDWDIKLLQADNIDELADEDKNPNEVRGDFEDLYNHVRNSFPNGTPFRWKGGGEFGLFISNISAPGATMSFTVNARPNTVISKSDKNGTISPSGVISVANGQSQTFTFKPYPGYEVNTVLVNASPVSFTGNQYTMNSFSGTKLIEVTYKRKLVLDPVPSPWQHTDIGTPPVSGVSGYDNGKFYLESNGWDIWGSYDHCRFVYQTLNGNGSIEGKLDFANKPHDWSKVGLMIRESLRPDAAHSMLMHTPRNLTRVQQRYVQGGNMTDGPDTLNYRHKYELYKWYKIIRNGDVITSYVSRDRKSWHKIAHEVIALPQQIYLGMAVSGQNDGYPCRAIFDSVTVSNNTNLPPVIAITNPSATINLTEPANIVLIAQASDPDGTIAKVEFLVNDSLIATDSVAPYSYYWTNIAGGVYTISAKATDNNGGVAFAYRNITIASNALPEVTLTSPVANASYSAPAQISITANASDANGYIIKVDFYNGSTHLYTDYSEPYSYIWNNVPAGTYSIKAQAMDNYGAVAYHTVSNITVANINVAPTVSITSPVSNASFTAPANITINSTASDSDGSVTRVEFYNGSTLLGIDTVAPYSYTWSGVAAGIYSITARAFDNQNASSEHTVSNITVANSTADITGPACANNNETLTYELSPAKRANATGYGWYFTGSTQSFSPSSTIPYQVLMSTGNNFGAGQLCVGVNMNVSPWYTTYCITVPKCSSVRMAETENEWVELTSSNSVSFPNPFENEVTITLPYPNENVFIEVFNANGNRVQNTHTTGSYTFGKELSVGVYFVKISLLSKTETIKVVKK